jgi:hypothetical protein
VRVAELLILVLLLGSVACGSDSEEEKLGKAAGFEVYLPSDVPSPLNNDWTSKITNGREFGRSVEVIYRSEANAAILRITESASGPMIPEATEATTVRGTRVFLTQNNEFEWQAYLHHASTDIFLEYRNTNGSVMEGLIEVVDSLLSD